MSGKNGLVLRIVLGGFLAYQGIKLLMIPVQDRPENFIPLAICAIVFIVIGAAFVINTLRNYIRFSKETDIKMVSYEELKKEESKEMEIEKGEDDLCE